MLRHWKLSLARFSGRLRLWADAFDDSAFEHPLARIAALEHEVARLRTDLDRPRARRRFFAES